MALKAEIRKWATEEFGFTDEELDSLPTKQADALVKAHGGYLRQSDYDRRMNEGKADLEKTRTQLADANEKLTRDMAEWASLTAGEKDNANALRERLEKAEQRVFTLTQKATRLAEESGVDPKTILGDEPPPEPKPKPQPTAYDDTTIRQQIGAIGAFALDMPTIEDIAEEHRELFGERFKRSEFIAELKAEMTAGKVKEIDLRKRWEDKFGVAAKREEKAKAEREAWGAERYNAGIVAGRSEAMLPNTRPVGQGTAPAFRSTGPSKLQRPQPGDRLAKARTALAEGRYRDHKMPQAS